MRMVAGSPWPMNGARAAPSVLSFHANRARMPRLLIAEDDPTMGALLSESLRAAGYVVVLSIDGTDARRQFATAHFDLCILDVMLPGKDGFELAREIRELDPQAVFMFL